MSRRIQLVRTAREFAGALPCKHTTTELRIYSPAGKATLEHDAEMLLLAIAAAVVRGSGPVLQRIGWVLNGVAVDESPGVVDALHGRSRVHRRGDDAKIVGEEIVFDAGEFVHEGEVNWRMDVGSAWHPMKKGDILTPAEMVYSAAAVLMKRPSV